MPVSMQFKLNLSIILVVNGVQKKRFKPIYLLLTYNLLPDLLIFEVNLFGVTLLFTFGNLEMIYFLKTETI